ncbi:MAG TPA: PAS domain S-box protein [Urbifossiella sp.]|nr:PAS domain S-box protein [Urbifossiella sp.]
MGLWTLDLDTGLHTRDATLNHLLGLAPAETTQPFDDFVARAHPDDRTTLTEAFARAARDGTPLNVEFRVVLPDGAVRWFRDQGDVTEAGRVLAGAVVDVSDRRHAQDAARQGDERLRRILDSATDFAVLTLNADRTVTSWSPGAELAFGHAADEILGRSADILFTPEDRAAGVPEQEVGTAQRDGRAADERFHLRKDGTRFYASGVMTPLTDGGADGFVKVARDLTERKRMEDELRLARDHLEDRVAERTAALTAALEALEGEMARRRELARRLATAQEDERRRVSRDLHDTVGQLVTGLSLAATAARAAGTLPEAAARLDDVRRLADEVGRELHGLAVRLRPTALDDLGLAAALSALVTVWGQQSGVRAEVQVTGLEAGRLPAEVETALYRVVQEALTNVAKHTQAAAVAVTIGVTDGAAAAVVEDDGAGFEPEGAGTGRLGLVGMRERLALVGGTLEVESSPGGGTTVIARVPLAGG